MNSDPLPTTIILAHEPAFTLGGLVVRPSTREVVAGEVREILEPRVMQVLVVLAQRDGMVASRDDLTARCWGGRVVGEDAINRVIARLRRLSERDQGRHFTLETVRKVGYRLLPASVAQAPAEIIPFPAPVPDDGRIAPEAAPAPAPSPQPATRIRGWWAKWRVPALLASATLLILLSATALALTWRLYLHPGSIATDAAPAPALSRATSDAALDEAMALFRDAVERRPDLARGWSGLAMAYIAGLAHPDGAQDDAELTRAQDAARRVLDLRHDDFGA